MQKSQDSLGLLLGLSLEEPFFDLPSFLFQNFLPVNSSEVDQIQGIMQESFLDLFVKLCISVETWGMIYLKMPPFREEVEYW